MPAPLPGGAGGGPGTQGPIGPTFGVQKITPAQVAGVAALAGFHGQALVMAVAISFAENGSHDIRAVNHNQNGTTDTGLWQINSVHSQWNQAQLVDPHENARAAYQLSNGGASWAPWTTFQTGAYRAQIPAAQSAITQMYAQGGPSKVGDIQVNTGGPPLPGEPIVTGIVGGVKSLSGLIGDLTDTGTWERVAFIIAGLGAMAFGLFALLKSLGLAPPIPVPV